ncbi:hypothetical protein C8F04DRAFT_1184149 [Mycena alexandri]|uniref:N-acetyltransferase domain-containing protein n=1 Tax=Mycena alexandri TaxID=1745969 RepID=A0AAD6SSW2_9AGAR|nr:hypothetical protein C8F04DRAFT_1184149 [Mycena alexandri]
MSSPTVTKKPRIQPIISRISVQDAHAAATVQLNALGSHPTQLRIQPLDKRPSVPTQINIRAQALRDALAGGQRRVIKAVVSRAVDSGVEDSEVAGVAVWMLFNEKKPQLEDGFVPAPPRQRTKEDEEALVGVDVEFRDKRVAIMTETLVLALLNANTGQALLQWGLDQADAEGLEAYLESSDAGRQLYEKNGFQIVGWNVLPDEQFEGGVLKWPALKRGSTNQGSLSS